MREPLDIIFLPPEKGRENRVLCSVSFRHAEEKSEVGGDSQLSRPPAPEDVQKAAQGPSEEGEAVGRALRRRGCSGGVRPTGADASGDVAIPQRGHMAVPSL